MRGASELIDAVFVPGPALQLADATGRVMGLAAAWHFTPRQTDKGHHEDELIDFTADEAIWRPFLRTLIEALMGGTGGAGGSSAGV